MDEPPFYAIVVLNTCRGLDVRGELNDDATCLVGVAGDEEKAIKMAEQDGHRFGGTYALVRLVPVRLLEFPDPPRRRYPSALGPKNNRIMGPMFSGGRHASRNGPSNNNNRRALPDFLKWIGQPTGGTVHQRWRGPARPQCPPPLALVGD